MATTPTTLAKATITQTVFENIYDRLKDNVTVVTLADSSTSTIQTYSSSFPDKPLDDKTDYPILIVNSPNIEWEDFTFTKKRANGSITIDIFTTKAETADKFIDAIIESVETYRADLRGAEMQFVNLESTTKNEFFRGQIKVHIKSVTFTFKFVFTKTQTY